MLERIFRDTKLSNIAKNLKAYRIKSGSSQKEFASLLNVNVQNYSKLERGKYLPSLEKLLDICEILCVTPNDLLMDGEEYEQKKAMIFENFDNDIVDFINIVEMREEQRAEILNAKVNKDTEKEKNLLIYFINEFAVTNEDFWDVADYLYNKKMAEYIQKSMSRARSKIMKNKYHIEKYQCFEKSSRWEKERNE